MKIWTKTQALGVAAFLLGASVLLSRFMGLIRDKVISYWFGASIESDLYFAAFVIPDFINYLLAGAYFSITMIPLLNRLFLEKESEGWNFFSAVVFWIFISVTTCTAVGELFAQSLAGYVAPGFSKEHLERLALFVRIILPAQIFFLTGACFTTILYMRKQFIIPSLSPLIYNGMIILFGIAFPSKGMEGFCWGVLAGSFLGNFFLPFMVARSGGLKLRWNIWHKEMKSFIKVSLPLMIGQSIVVLDEQFVRIFGSLAGEGTVSHISYARRLMMVPVGVIGQAAAVASYPFLAELFAHKKMQEFFLTIRNGIKKSLFLVIPVILAMALLSEPIVALIFQQGKFRPEDTTTTALMLRVYLTAVPLWVYQQILGRAFYATGDTLWPIVWGTATTVISVPIFYYGANTFGGIGIIVASLLGFIIYDLTLSLLWLKRWGDTIFLDLLIPLLRYLFTGFAALLLSSVLKFEFPSPVSSKALEYLFSALGKGLVFLFAFTILAFMICKNEMREVLRKISKSG